MNNFDEMIKAFKTPTTLSARYGYDNFFGKMKRLLKTKEVGAEIALLNKTMPGYSKSNISNRFVVFCIGLEPPTPTGKEKDAVLKYGLTTGVESIDKNIGSFEDSLTTQNALGGNPHSEFRDVAGVLFLIKTPNNLLKNSILTHTYLALNKLIAQTMILEALDMHKGINGKLEGIISPCRFTGAFFQTRVVKQNENFNSISFICGREFNVHDKYMNDLRNKVKKLFDIIRANQSQLEVQLAVFQLHTLYAELELEVKRHHQSILYFVSNKETNHVEIK